MTLTAYRTSLRLIRAKQLLATTDDKVADVAQACGFTNVSYFTELFSANESMTPTKYRALHRQGKTS
jgi:two-component system response regulator YesN